MIFVDTSAFYAFLSKDDQDHDAVVDEFRRCLEDGATLIATSYVVAETMGLVQRRLGLAVLRRFVDDVLPLVQIHWMGASEHAAAWLLLQRVRRRAFTIVDGSSAAGMTAMRSRRILALDPDFGRLGFDALPGAYA